MKKVQCPGPSGIQGHGRRRGHCRPLVYTKVLPILCRNWATTEREVSSLVEELVLLVEDFMVVEEVVVFEEEGVEVAKKGCLEMWIKHKYHEIGGKKRRKRRGRNRRGNSK